MKRVAIYPGTFDPITNGHVDVIKRALELCDAVHIAIACNISKEPLFNTEERLVLVKEAIAPFKGVYAEVFDGLVVEFARRKKARIMIRGIRALSDFDYEFQMALTNRKLDRSIETIFLMPSEDHFYISSQLIKEIAFLRGSVSQFVPSCVAKALKKRVRTVSRPC